MSTKTIAIITNNPDRVFQHAVIDGMEQIIKEQGYQMLIHPFTEDPKYPHDISLDLSQLAGILVIANILPDDLLARIRRMGKPVSLVSHQIPNAPIAVVKSNNAQGIAELVRHMVNICHRRNLVFIRGLMDQNDGREREAAFRQEIIRYNLHVPETRFLRGDFSPDTAAQSVRALVASKERFDGIISSDYVMAIAAIEALREAGIGVPTKVSVVGFGDDAEAEVANLTTVAANISELGRCAARQLISQINGMQITGVTMLSVRLVVRKTC